MAVWLAWDCHSYRAEPAVAHGWLRRAARLLEGLEPTPEHGWHKVREAEIALDHGELVAARRLGVEAAALGRALGILDLEMLGLSIEGLAMVAAGQVEAGMAQLDEATAAALGGELRDPAAIGEACCPDRPAALREARRVTAPDGRLALAVMRTLQHKAAYAQLAALLERHAGAEAGA